MARSKQPTSWTVVEKALSEKYSKVDFTCVVSNGLTKSIVGFTSDCCGYQERNVRSILTTKHLCMKCVKKVVGNTKTKDYDNVLLKFTEVHGSHYTYPEVNRLNYVNRKSVIVVCCEHHGNFQKRAQKHISGQGCFECRVSEMKADGTLSGGYSEDFFELNPSYKELPAELYYLQVGKSFKVGITRVSVDNRIRAIRSKSKQETNLVFTLSGTLYECYCYEQYLLLKYKHFRNYPKWSTEVFSEDVFKKCYPNNLNLGD